jgi:hypothetical protein
MQQGFGVICVITPGSAGNDARDTDIPRRLRIRARHSWNPSVIDVIVNT